jgi:hypothetical protein
MTGSASSGHAAPRCWRAGSYRARFESRPNRCLQSAKPDNQHFRGGDLSWTNGRNGPESDIVLIPAYKL